jgi:hypothetical protein
LDTFKRQFPSRGELFYTFAVGVFFVHLWTFYNVFHEVPAWVIRMSLWDVIGVVSYVLLFALVDSLLLAGGLTAVAVVLPNRWFKDNFVAQGSVAALLISAFAVFFHLQGDALDIWSFKRLLFWGGIAALSVVLVSFIVNRIPRASVFIRGAVERIVVVSAIYLFLDIFSVLVVVARNLYGWLA